MKTNDSQHTTLRKISLLGSTGSIGRQTLDVCSRLNIRVAAMTCGRNLNLFEQQIRQFNPALVGMERETDAQILRQRLSDLPHPPDVLSGREANRAAACHPESEAVVAAMVGVAGLDPVLAALALGRTILLANKETLVAGGALVQRALRQWGGELRPVDSEHSAIWQCLAASPGQLDRILLTASGGPFRGYTAAELEHVTAADALRHPNWTMGPKITIDSATLMNKGLEVIEAYWLFDRPADKIEVVVHPQSIIHSMVAFTDGSVLAQMGFPDMKLPIQLALTWPERLPSDVRPFDPFAAGAANLTFEPPDWQTFPLLGLAYQALRAGGAAPAILNSANEAAVALFLAGRIRFPEIAGRVAACLDESVNWSCGEPELEELMDLDRRARQTVERI